jgi:hypothetical protein
VWRHSLLRRAINVRLEVGPLLMAEDDDRDRPAGKVLRLIERNAHQRPCASVSRLRAAKSITAFTCSRSRSSLLARCLSMFVALGSQTPTGAGFDGAGASQSRLRRPVVVSGRQRLLPGTLELLCRRWPSPVEKPANFVNRDWLFDQRLVTRVRNQEQLRVRR